MIPADMRKALGLAVGDKVLMRVEDGELRIFSVDRAIRRVQETVAKYIEHGHSLADELIAERRAEAARE